MTALTEDNSAALLAAYQSAATTAGTTLNATSSTTEAAAASITPGLTTVMKAFYGILASEITAAATNNAEAADFAQALMTLNSATKLLTLLRSLQKLVLTSMQMELIYTQRFASSQQPSKQSSIPQTYAGETIGDVFGDDTANNFAYVVVNMLTTGNDDETLTSASEIIPTFDGTDTVNAGDGNDKVIGGSNVDTFYGQGGNDHLMAIEAMTSLMAATAMTRLSAVWAMIRSLVVRVMTTFSLKLVMTQSQREREPMRLSQALAMILSLLMEPVLRRLMVGLGQTVWRSLIAPAIL